ncbi:MAG: hypothetical protein A2086_08070 [Spirochaetes bacterium GWD1_27_9]|nr:MAG: hypothetical protein A2Z98_13950 [Spirochaetes bacterium GWB1_27_13]OHD25146.1 MAG: hypothetical protein A2Y34_16790 [Spirochaetes bacterium GWC1_27_15]OHD34476.1 MAG: hypothetical protein A2086_08070 [Spirochaetes bacterium GWD1_27_9]
MLPEKTNPKWKKLLTGEINHNFKSIPAAMMVSRLKREIKKNDSPEHAKKLIEEVYNFFSKFEVILTEDIKVIFK